MIWLTWRQQRVEALMAAAVMAALAALLLVTGRHAEAVYRQSGLAGCTGRQSGGCAAAMDRYSSHFTSLLSLTNWFNLVPLVLGVLLAAPIVLELEQGTHRLAWTQSITRRRWLAARLGAAVAAAAVAGLALTLLMTWWRGPFDHIDGRLGASAFDFEGSVPIAYTVFAAALVLAAGVVTRRTLVAVAVGLVGFLALRFGTEGWLRFHYLAPLHRSWTPGGAPPRGEASGWISDSGLSMPASFHGSPATLARACGLTGTSPHQLEVAGPCLRHQGAMQYAVYQPETRFWALQGIETALFLGLAALLFGLAAWWVMRRIA